MLVRLACTMHELKQKPNYQRYLLVCISLQIHSPFWYFQVFIFPLDTRCSLLKKIVCNLRTFLFFQNIQQTRTYSNESHENTTEYTTTRFNFRKRMAHVFYCAYTFLFLLRVWCANQNVYVDVRIFFGSKRKKNTT